MMRYPGEGKNVPGHSPHTHTFPAQNPIVSGWCSGNAGRW